VGLTPNRHWVPLIPQMAFHNLISYELHTLLANAWFVVHVFLVWDRVKLVKRMIGYPFLLKVFVSFGRRNDLVFI
jgi:hypothetical protein